MRISEAFEKLQCELQVLGSKSCLLCDSGEHSRTYLFIVMEGKHKIGPAGTRERAV